MLGSSRISIGEEMFSERMSVIIALYKSLCFCGTEFGINGNTKLAKEKS